MFERLLAKRHIRNLDLSCVRTSLMDKEGWIEGQAARVDREYRCFLCALAHRNNGEMISPPTQEVDQFWHYHILDTRKYRDDCHTVFGHYIDHTPNLSPDQQLKADSRRKEIYDE